LRDSSRKTMMPAIGRSASRQSRGKSSVTDTPRRAVIYARFSSDLQDVRSVADQVALCREHAARQRWTVIQVYADEAISCASMHGRLGLQRLVDDAGRGAFDVILVEDIDRLSRNAADTIRLREQMEFIGIEIHTCASGLVTELHAGLGGLMSSMFLKNLATRVRRGQAGRVRDGLSGAAASLTAMRPCPANGESASSLRKRPPSCAASLRSTLPAGRRATSPST
jgi:DNA invertase Pin-like site-specific DNA recombinase